MKRGEPLKRRTPLRRAPVADTAPAPRRRQPGGRSRQIPLGVRRAVLARDGNRCQAPDRRVPGRCIGNLHLHHLRRRSQGGLDVAENLVTLCTAHHLWVHEHPAAASTVNLLIIRPLPD